MPTPPRPESPLSASGALTVTLNYLPRGAAREVFAQREPEVLLSGPAGTGKSRAILEKVHLACLKHPGSRWVMLRKTRRSLTESGMVTFEQRVRHPLDGVVWKSSVQQYQYPNGSILAVGGMDKPGKIMSSEWDGAYIQEATELTEADWEAITTRLRNGRMPYQQLLADCNPDAPTHWLKKRCDTGKTVMLQSWHEDNPTLYDAASGEWTPGGATYISKLDALSGVRYLRLRKGIWAAAEGMVYQDAWSPERNIVDRFPIPADWPRYLSVDFGYTHPFVCLWWAMDTDGRLYCYREIYMTQRLVEDHARQIKSLSRWGQAGGDPFPRAIICDHDAEDRATLERHLGMMTIAAHKTVRDGIQAVAARLRPAGDNRPRLVYLRDSLFERDPALADRQLPGSVTEEYESYVWQRKSDGSWGEEPVKDFDHGLDVSRYMVAHLDLLTGLTGRMGPRLF